MVSRCIATLDEEKPSIVNSVAVMKNGRQFVSATDLIPPVENAYSWSIKLWDLESRQSLKTFANYTGVDESRCHVFSLDDESFVCFFFEIGVLVQYSIASNEHVKIIELDNEPTTMNQLAVIDRDRFLIGTEYGDVEVWSFDSGEQLRTFHLVDFRIRSITKVDDMRFLSDAETKVLLFNAETGDVVKTIDINGSFNSIALLDSMRFLTMDFYLADEVNTREVKMWNINTGECVQSVRTTCPIDDETVHACGHGILFTNLDDFEIKLWGTEMGIVKKCFIGHELYVQSIDLVNDSMFISGSNDGTIKIWDLSRWPDLKTLICLRKLVFLGRAEEAPHSRNSACERIDWHDFLHDLVYETPDDVFRTVLCFMA